MKKFILINIVFSLIFVSCQKGGGFLPSACGRMGELVIVVNNSIWDGVYGDSIRNIFGAPQPMLPQDEPYFDIMHVGNNTFSNLLKKQRNIVYFTVSDSITKPDITYKRNVWAGDQLVVNVYAQNEKQMLELLKKEEKVLVYRILQIDRKRIQNYYKSIKNTSVIKELKNQFHLDMVVPEGYRIMKKDSNFIWMQYETDELIQAILVYRRPYDSFNQFNITKLLDYRDTIAKRYVPGPTPNSYMTTYREIQPQLIPIQHNKKYTAEVRGLWKVQNDFMGGPFISLTAVDNKNNLVTVEGFVYAPKFDKRNYLRQLEAIIYTAQF